MKANRIIDITAFAFLIFAYAMGVLLFLFSDLYKLGTVTTVLTLVLMVISGGTFLIYLLRSKWGCCPYCKAVISKRNIWFTWKHRVLACHGCGKTLVIKRRLSVWYKIIQIAIFVSLFAFPMIFLDSGYYDLIWIYMFMIMIPIIFIFQIRCAKLEKDT